MAFLRNQNSNFEMVDSKEAVKDEKTKRMPGCQRVVEV